ncbi:MAG: DEAD/DEAH box helicase [Desulfatirhabdiaceae bacterium]
MRRGRYYEKKDKVTQRAETKARVRLKPAADKSLKRVFAEIGVPEQTPFVPDAFQLQALEAVQKSDCLVTAPTGSGKTWIAVQAISRIFEKKGKAWYASPLKALTNSKFQEFSDIFGPQHVGILTGDRKENADASIIVGTTEILRNQLYDAMHLGETLNTDFVVLDEAHYLGDEERGVVWEETMIYLPPRIPLLMLSATIGNAHQIADWLSTIRSRPCIVIEETRRPVPLYPLMIDPSGTLLPLLGSVEVREKSRMSKKVKELADSSKSMAPGRKLPHFGDILHVLETYNLLPAIFFLKSRSDCDYALNLCEDFPLDDPQHRKRLRERVKRMVRQSPHIAGHRQLKNLQNLGVGSHHSGQLPAWKLVIETLMTEGLLKAVFATSTVAAGVNFPARTVVFLNTDRFNGRDFMPLTPTEFHQMTGRAGRRGMDEVGFAVGIPGRYLDPFLYAGLVTADPSDVVSQIKINFSMTLNLLLSHEPDQIEDILTRSFAAFSLSEMQKKMTIKKIEYEPSDLLRDSFQAHLQFLQETGYVSYDGSLTSDGLWASRLRVDQPLLIAEGFRHGVFPETSPELLAAMMALFATERDTGEALNQRILPENLVRAFQLVRRTLRPFIESMRIAGFETRKLSIGPAAVVYAWASGMAWEDVVTLSESAEGDLVMLMLRTADNLRHVHALGRSFPDAAKTAMDAIDLLYREPVMLEIG